jgi:hypothetical protein
MPLESLPVLLMDTLWAENSISWFWSFERFCLAAWSFWSAVENSISCHIKIEFECFSCMGRPVMNAPQHFHWIRNDGAAGSLWIWVRRDLLYGIAVHWERCWITRLPDTPYINCVQNVKRILMPWCWSIETWIWWKWLPRLQLRNFPGKGCF